MRAGVTEAFVRSLHTVFIVGLPVLLLALGLALTLQEIPLGSRSAHARGAIEEGTAGTSRGGTAEG